MRTLQYAEKAHQREGMALEPSIGLMVPACAASTDAANDLAFTNNLWSLPAQDLAAENNGRAHELRAQIETESIWILRELESIRGGRSNDAITRSRATRDGQL